VRKKSTKPLKELGFYHANLGKKEEEIKYLKEV